MRNKLESIREQTTRNYIATNFQPLVVPFAGRRGHRRPSCRCCCCSSSRFVRSMNASSSLFCSVGVSPGRGRCDPAAASSLICRVGFFMSYSSESGSRSAGGAGGGGGAGRRMSARDPGFVCPRGLTCCLQERIVSALLQSCHCPVQALDAADEGWTLEELRWRMKVSIGVDSVAQQVAETRTFLVKNATSCAFTNGPSMRTVEGKAVGTEITPNSGWGLPRL